MSKPDIWEWRSKSIEYYNQACFHFVYGNETLLWEKLFLWAEADWELINCQTRYRKNTSPRQAEQQKLAGQLRLITGMIGQAKHLRYTGNGVVFMNLDRAISDMRQIEANLRHLLSNIKERIPA
jgi:hypothetical protein